MKLAPGVAPIVHEPGRPAVLPPAPARTLSVRLYGAMLRGTLRHPWLTVAAVVLMFGGSYYLFNKYVSRGRVWGGAFGSQSSYISIQIQQQRGEELEQTDMLARFFEERLKEMPEVARFETRVMAERGSIFVYFPEEYENTDIPVAIKEQLYQYSLGWGGADVRVYGYGPSFYGGGGSAPNYTIQVLGYNYEHVREIAESVGERLKRFSRVRDVDTNSSGRYVRDKAVELVLDVDREKLALHDVTAADVVAQVSAAVRGQTANRTLVVAGEERQFSLKLDGYQTMDMHRLNELLIPAPGGDALRLGTVASLRERNVLSTVRRENQQYERSVSYEFRGPPKLGDRTRDQVVKATFLPPGYTIKASQSYSWSVEEKKAIYGVLALSVLLVFMVTAAVFESIKLPLCVLLTVPMALIGVFLVFFYTGASFTREAYVGVIMMGGIVVNNSILLVDHVNQLRRIYGLPLAEALERGTIERVRPILITSLTTIGGLLPLVLFSRTADANIWNALTYSLIGGLASSTILVLTVTPALYLMFERRAEKRRVMAAAAAGA
jgi:HAE1 family hydrophobic/amphiphilic exporter-1